MRKILSVALAVGLAATSVVALGSSASADATSVVLIKGSASGLALSRNTVHAGRITFRVSTTASAGTNVVMFKPARHVTLDQVFADLQEELSSNLATAAKGTRDLVRDVRFFGLPDVVVGSPESVTENLRAGTYYLFDLAPLLRGGGRPPLVTLRVRGEAEGEDLGDTRATVSVTSADRFVVSGRLPAHGSVLVRNIADTIHLMTIVPVAPGTTDAAVQAFFDGSGPPPFIAGPTAGVDVLSPGVRVRLSYNVPAGTYVLMCFISDDVTGMPHAAMGMHKVVVLK